MHKQEHLIKMIEIWYEGHTTLLKFDYDMLKQMQELD